MSSWSVRAIYQSVREHRVNCLQRFEFTERQAAFLVHVLVYSGVFVERQYCRFAGITHGRKTHDFLRMLTDRGYAKVIILESSIQAGCTTSTTSRFTRRLVRPTAGIDAVSPWAVTWSG